MFLVVSSRDDVLDTVAVVVGTTVPIRRISTAEQLWRGSHYAEDRIIGVIIDFREEVKHRCALVDRIVRSPRGPGILAVVEEHRGELIFELARRGVHAWVPAPPTFSALRTALQKAVVETTVSAESEEGFPDVVESARIEKVLEPLAGPSDAARELRRAVVKVARSDMPVVLTGETGAGKQIVAEVIHSVSPRWKKSLVDVNVSSIVETLFEVEFFGSETGAYTGANRRRPGFFSSSAGGTLFLDEIGDLPVALQPKILKVVETGQVRALGSDRVEHVDVRLISATNREIDRMVTIGAFRRDLWNRIAAVIIRVPPIRERLEDMPFLVRSILREKKYGGATVKPEAIRALQHHQWTGNVRELRSVLERSILVSCRRELRARDLLFDPHIGNHLRDDHTPPWAIPGDESG
ncbi:MAG: sigma-54-dependent Fis family transcriptional regulator [Spirochaetaceae bacterium]|nr:MAG: sigma-54-dependent Fis family transcriptional regulator [Spirochaetaceae bacterium]